MSPPNVYTVGMTENKFKVGDKARVINADNTSFDVGDIVELKNFDPVENTWGCYKEGGTLRQWFYPSQLEHIDTPIPAPEIIVGGRTYRLVEPEAPAPKEGQVWRDTENDLCVITDENDKDGNQRIMHISSKYRGVMAHHEAGGTFIAHSLREALESGKIKAEDL